MRSVTFQFYIESLCRETFPLFKKIKYNIRCIFISNMRNLPAVSVRLKTMQFLSSGFKTNINVKFIKKYWKSSNTALTEDIKLSLDSHAITTCYSLYIILSKFFTPCHHSILFNFSRDSLLSVRNLTLRIFVFAHAQTTISSYFKSELVNWRLPHFSVCPSTASVEWGLCSAMRKVGVRAAT